MEFQRQGSADWHGDLLSGHGFAATASGAVQGVAMRYAQRFGEEPGSNPEELIGAAHASCFSMALAGRLARNGFAPERIRTTATVTLRKEEAGFSIRAVHLDTEARVAGLDAAAFREHAEGAKDACPVSRLLAPGLESLTVEARLAE
jgi:osmotically inducible protein OsmC